ncbi:nucleotidyltransferase domain-containing protein [Laspinema palackyanum]|uniref:nucleotidyltransferase domain-containing protein n=1 Tax=Laspinema palackyanum TaxID=3231601 RepID=UPI00345D9A95|nr:nucleotidyltransferase family protein [Laspinema sp. D2c]
MTVLTESIAFQDSTQFPLEIDLLLCCCRTQMSAEYAARIHQLVQQNINWNYLVNTARRHEVIPLLYWQLKNVCPEAVPQDILNKLRSAFSANAKKNLAITVDLVKILNLFQNHNIPVIALKGPVLACYAYNNLGLRTFVDLDILVPEEFALAAIDLLTEHGYERMYKFKDFQIPRYIKLRNELAFVFESKNFSIDLHWALMPEPLRSVSKLLSYENQEIYIGSNKFKIPTLSAESLLLFLCIHSTKHSWSSLKFVCDLAEVIRSKPELDWKLIESQAESLGTKNILFLGLYLCQELLGTVLPKEISQKLEANPQLKIWISQIKQQLFEAEGRINFFKKHRIYLQTLSWKNKLSFYFNTLVTPTPYELIMVSLPDWLFPLYYLLRPIRMFVKYSNRLISGSGA